MTRPGGDLPLDAGPGLPDGLTIPAADLVERFSRSPGPGGQSVNTTDSRVELEYDVGRRPPSPNRSGPGRSRAWATGWCRAASSSSRPSIVPSIGTGSRPVSGMAGLLRDALAPPPPPRRPTRPTKGSKQRRLDTKKQRGQVKELRGTGVDDE